MNEFKKDFVKNYILPAFLLFLVPAVGVWFYDYGASYLDSSTLESIQKNIDVSTKMNETQKAEAREFYSKALPSVVCSSSSPDLKDMREDYKSLCADLKIFALLKSASLYLLLFGVFSLLFVVVLSALSSSSQPAQYKMFVLGYNFSKVASVIQVLGQGLILTSLSYYMTALWTNRYFPKVIFMVGAVMLIAAYNIIKTIFTRIENKMPIHPETTHLLVISENKKLIGKIQDICKKLNTQGPDNILLGVDDNFFVTEAPIQYGDKVLTGRTLYVSLFQLKHLERVEAESILAHEMAHFSGEDTLFSKKTSPMIQKVQTYMDILFASLLTRPIFYFIMFFMALFQVSFQKMSREREKRADLLAAETTGSGQHLITGLMKIIGYAQFREVFENSLFDKKQQLQKLDLLNTMRVGFQSHVKENIGKEILEEKSSHPFDSHPTLFERMEALKVQISPEKVQEIVSTIPTQSWYHDIHDAEKIEAMLMEGYEASFKRDHERALAIQYMPDTEEERIIVEKFYPAKTFTGKGGETIVIDYEKITASADKQTVYFKNISEVQYVAETLSSFVRVTQKETLPKEEQKLKIKVNAFGKQKDEIFGYTDAYLRRYLTAVELIRIRKESADVGHAQL